MHHKLPRGLYALVDDSVRPELDLLEKARLVIEGGARVLQLRLEHTADRDALEVARAVKALAGKRAKVILNDRVDLALLAGVDGVHLGQTDMPAGVARELLGPKFLLGVTVRNVDQIDRAQTAGADHVGLGPVFASSTKRLEEPLLGVEGLARLCARSVLPVVAISGIDEGSIGAVAAAGAWAAAVASGLLGAPDISARARELQSQFDRGAFLAARPKTSHSGWR